MKGLKSSLLTNVKLLRSDRRILEVTIDLKEMFPNLY